MVENDFKCKMSSGGDVSDFRWGFSLKNISIFYYKTNEIN